jgi:hypothetical protein
MLTDIQIDDLAKKMNIPFGGCYFKNELPKLDYNKVYIINLQDSETDNGEQNEGTHWTMAYIRQTPKGQKQPIYFDSYGCPPPENVKKIIESQTNYKECPYTTKDIQSLMNNACGFYCLAMAHFICASKYRINDLYKDVDDFIEIFDDLNHSIDWKKNEYILKMFFQSENGENNKNIDVLPKDHSFYNKITDETMKGGIDITKLPVNLQYK